MNKNNYKVISNKACGLLVVVGETAKSKSKGIRSPSIRGLAQSAVTPLNPGPDPGFLLLLRPVCFSLLLALGLVSFSSYAQIVPGAGGPDVNHAQNGVPVVNINTPSNAGVSHNRYSRFDVEQNGAILNNAIVNSQT